MEDAGSNDLHMPFHMPTFRKNEVESESGIIIQKTRIGGYLFFILFFGMCVCVFPQLPLT